VIVLLACWSAAAVAFFHHRGYILYYGDAESHLNIARRIVDSRTPGIDQVGTVWLPLPHLLMAPFASRDDLWQSGLAGAIPSAACFVMAGTFLFAAARRVFSSDAAGAAALALFALNPNVMYLHSTPMSEPAFFAAFMAALYFTVLFRENQAWWSAAGAGIACLAGTLARYEGWFLIPAVTLYFLFAARRHRLRIAVWVAAIASLGPLAWLAHNWYWFGDALYFARGPSSAEAIQGGKQYYGHGDWLLAATYYQAAAAWCAGAALRWIGALGMLAAVARRAFWPLVFLALPGVFYVWNIHSGATPIHIPNLEPYTWYNTRYGLAVLPLAAFAAGALVTFVPPTTRGWAVLGLALAATGPWLLYPSPENWITWKESQVNSVARREWTRHAATFLSAHYRRGDGIFTSFSDLTGIYRTMGIPLRETLTWDNEPQWLVTSRRPDLFLWEQWAVCMDGDPVQRAIHRALRQGPHYELVHKIMVKDAPVVEIYRRSLRYENPVH
jgi:Dolichyl-phosphate-mannose-protein mannosyltransferase